MPEGIDENAIKEAMQGVDELKNELLPKMDKLDAFDAEKFSKIEENVGDLLELAQKAEAAEKANKELLEKFEAEMNRPKGGETKEELESKEAEKLLTTSFNDFLRAENDEKATFGLHMKQLAKENPEDFKALSTLVGEDGGYLVPTQFGGIVNTRIFESSPVRQFADVVQVATNEYELVLDNDEASVGWVGETQTRPDTNTPTLDDLKIPVHELYAKPKATQRMLDDGIVDVESWLINKISDAFARAEATAFISGTGVKKPTGILTNVTSSASFDQTAIQTIASGSSGAFTYAGLVDLQSGLKEAYQANARFLLKRSSFGALLKLVDGQSRPIFNLTFDKNTGVSGGILGRPLSFADDVPAAAADALAAIYGDFKKGYTIVDRIGLRVLRDPYSAKPYVEFYATKRVGGAVVNTEALKIQKLEA